MVFSCNELNKCSASYTDLFVGVATRRNVQLSKRWFFLPLAAFCLPDVSCALSNWFVWCAFKTNTIFRTQPLLFAPYVVFVLCCWVTFTQLFLSRITSESSAASVFPHGGHYKYIYSRFDSAYFFFFYKGKTKPDKAQNVSFIDNGYSQLNLDVLTRSCFCFSILLKH